MVALARLSPDARVQIPDVPRIRRLGRVVVAGICLGLKAIRGMGQAPSPFHRAPWPTVLGSLLPGQAAVQPDNFWHAS
jgi:hypothetical protein